jgi:hypothetical protein
MGCLKYSAFLQSENTVLPIAFYGCKIWSLTLGKGKSLGIFGNRVLRNIFGPKKEEMTEDWK